MGSVKQDGEEMPTDVILDVDTGVDDALALLFAAAHPDLRLRAVSCVAGNTGIDRVVRNTLTVLETAGRTDVPVARGADRALLRGVKDAHYIHGTDGLGDLNLDPPVTAAADVHAVELLRRTITAHDGITVIALAPMTNLALLLRTYPELAERIGRIVFMGGSVGVGNTTTAAEFNIWHDPEAAAVVVDSGVPLTMYGLDVFYQVTVDTKGIERLLAAGLSAASLAGRLLEGRIGYGGKEIRIPDPDGGCIGDAGAVCAVADPDGLRTAPLPVHISLSNGPTRGMTLVDTRSAVNEVALHDGNPIGTGMIDVAQHVDRLRYANLYVETVVRHGAS
jgi:pyrimidine-specific ribonucleoside hydrolase